MVYKVQMFREGWGGLDHPWYSLPLSLARPVPLVAPRGIFFLSLYEEKKKGVWLGRGKEGVQQGTPLSKHVHLLHDPPC